MHITNCIYVQIINCIEKLSCSHLVTSGKRESFVAMNTVNTNQYRSILIWFGPPLQSHSNGFSLYIIRKAPLVTGRLDSALNGEGSGRTAMDKRTLEDKQMKYGIFASIYLRVDNK